MFFFYILVIFLFYNFKFCSSTFFQYTYLKIYLFIIYISYWIYIFFSLNIFPATSWIVFKDLINFIKNSLMILNSLAKILHQLLFCLPEISIVIFNYLTFNNLLISLINMVKIIVFVNLAKIPA